MRFHAGRMQLDLPADWRDSSAFEYRSPDDSASVMARLQQKAPGFDFRAVATTEYELTATGVDGASASPLEEFKMGEYPGLRGDISFKEGEPPKPVFLRLMFTKIGGTGFVSIWGNAGKTPWAEFEKIMNDLARNFVVLSAEKPKDS